MRCNQHVRGVVNRKWVRVFSHVSADLLSAAGLQVVLPSKSRNQVTMLIADLACWMFECSCQGVDAKILCCPLAQLLYLHLKRGGIRPGIDSVSSRITCGIRAREEYLHGRECELNRIFGLLVGVTESCQPNKCIATKDCCEGVREDK